MSAKVLPFPRRHTGPDPRLAGERKGRTITPEEAAHMLAERQAARPGPTAHLAAEWRARAAGHRQQAEVCDAIAAKFDHPCPPPRANEETGSPTHTEGDPR
jgi:hypothetical protein